MICLCILLWWHDFHQSCATRSFLPHISHLGILFREGKNFHLLRRYQFQVTTNKQQDNAAGPSQALEH